MFLNDNETAVDLLQYEPIARAVVGLVQQSKPTPITIGIHGDWGAGKSSILAMVEGAFKGAPKIATVRFNGWTSQGFEDAKVAMLQSIVVAIEESQSGKAEIKKLARKLIKRVNWLKVAKKTAGVGFTALTGIPTPDQISDLVSVAKTVVSVGAEKLAAHSAQDLVKKGEEFLQETQDGESSVPEEIQRFRSEFEALLKAAEIEQLIILIDDLDRCLPTTIIETLEAIRLFLFLERCAFVIAVDETMVEYAVKQHFPDLPSTVVAAGYARNYLEKLIQVPIRVPALGSVETKTYIALLLIESHLKNKVTFQPYLELARIAMAQPWMATGLDHAVVKKNISDIPSEAIHALDLAATITPILAEGTKGNPRQIKRFLNALILREQIAAARGLNAYIKRPVLVKLMLLERFAVGGKAYDELTQAALQSVSGTVPWLAKLEAPSATAEKIPTPKTPEEKFAFDESWSTDPIQTAWLRLSPPLATLDLRPYLFVCRDKKIFASSYSPDGKFAVILEQLAQGKLAANQAKGAVKNLDAASALQIFNQLRELVIQEDDFQSKPKPVEGMIVLAECHTSLQIQLIEFLGGLSVEKLGPWPTTGLANVTSEPKARAAFTTLCDRWAQQTTNAKLQNAAKLFRKIG